MPLPAAVGYVAVGLVAGLLALIRTGMFPKRQLCMEVIFQATYCDIENNSADTLDRTLKLFTCQAA